MLDLRLFWKVSKVCTKSYYKMVSMHTESLDWERVILCIISKAYTRKRNIMIV
jgi:hypothetical protein